jgi:hypothetical protein
MFQRFIIVTDNGEGIATKEYRNAAWHVAVPTGDFDFHGSVAEVKAEIRRFVFISNDKVNCFGVTKTDEDLARRLGITP